MSARAWVVFAAVSVLWGIPYLFIKIAVDDVSPGFVAWGRVVIAAVILLPVAWKMGALEGVRERWVWVLAYAACEIIVPFFLIAVGEQDVASSLASILIATMPLIVALLALRFAPEERPTPLRLLGLVLGFAGVVALLGIDVAGNGDELFGAACILVATVGYATAPIIIDRKLSTLHPMGPVTASVGVATLVLAPIAAATAPTKVPSVDAIVALVVLGVGCTAAGLVLFFVLITEAGPSRASVITYVNPVIAVTLGVVFLDEHLGAGAAVGLPLILVGSWLATMRARPAPHATPSELRPSA
jgi:drug/metabolite transporter (DMT)-like permease